MGESITLALALAFLLASWLFHAESTTWFFQGLPLLILGVAALVIWLIM